MDPNRKIVDERSVRPYVTPRQKRQRILVVVLLLVFAAIGAGAYTLLVPKEEVYRLIDYSTAVVRQTDLVITRQAGGAVEITSQLQLRSMERGYAAELFVAVGDAVSTGQMIARIDVPDLREELTDLKTDLETSRLNFHKVIQQNAVSVSRSRRQIEALESDIARARQDVAETEALVRISAATRNDVERKIETLEGLIRQKTERELTLEEDIHLQNLDVEIRQADLARLETRITRLEQRIAAATIRSPMDGEILEIERTLGVPGSVITANQALFTIVDPASAMVELEVDEQYASLLDVGGAVKLTIGGTSFSGSIAGIGRVATMTSDGLGATVAVSVAPHVDSGFLLQGASAVGEFELGVKEGVLLLPRGPYLTTGGQRFVFLVTNGTAVKTEVAFGETRADVVELIRGLSAGDEIITSGYQNYIGFRTIRLGRSE